LSSWDEYYCPKCGAILNDQDGFDPDLESWICKECGMHLFDESVYSGELYEDVLWYCDECGALLNKQSGFSDYYSSWTCEECGHYNPIDEDEIRKSDPDEDNDHWVADTIVDTLAEIAYRYDAYKNMEGQSEYQYSKRQSCQNKSLINKIKYKQKRRKRRRLFIILCIITILFAGSLVESYKYRIPVGFSLESCLDKDYSDVEDEFKNAGFTNIKVTPEKELEYEETDQINKVKSVKVGLARKFDSFDEYPYFRQVVITYKDMKEIKVPVSSREAKKMKYNDLVFEVEEAGFKDIETKIEYDVVVGFLAKAGDVESMTIDGDEKYTSTDKYPVNAKVVITYHASVEDKKK